MGVESSEENNSGYVNEKGEFVRGRDSLENRQEKMEGNKKESLLYLAKVLEQVDDEFSGFTIDLPKDLSELLDKMKTRLHEYEEKIRQEER